ncbi:hypothetical protein [Necropsobacter rosorum]
MAAKLTALLGAFYSSFQEKTGVLSAPVCFWGLFGDLLECLL